MRRFMAWVIAYAFVAGSVTLACLYAVLSATGLFAYGKALALGLCAIGGCHGPAYIAKNKKAYGWSGAALTALGTLACLLVTLWGGLGTMSSGGAQTKAERSKVVSDAKRDRSEVARLGRERLALGTPRPTNAITAELETSRTASLYKITEGCRPEYTSSPKATAHCASFRRLEAELATSQQAAKLDGDISTINERLAHAPAEIEPDPQAAATSALTGWSVEASAALYAILVSIALEIFGMAAMMAAHAERPNKAAEKGADPQEPESPFLAHKPSRKADLPPPIRRKEITPIQPTNVVALPKPGVYGSVKKFVLACVHPAPGERVQVRALYDRYREWCRAGGVPASDLTRFLDEIEALARKTGLSIEPVEGQVYALDVRLSA